MLILGNPEPVKNLGLVYPVKLKDYYLFSFFAQALNRSKESLNMQDSEISLYDILVDENLRDEENRGNFFLFLSEILKIVTKENVKFIEETYSFIIGDSTIENIDGKEIEIESERFLNASNFEEFRELVCAQNVVIEERFYKPFFKKMIEEERVRRAKSNKGISLQTMMTVVSTEMGVGYEFMNDMTYMQFLSNYRRISIKENYNTSILFKASGNFKDVTIPDLYEEIDLFRHPDDDIYSVGVNPFGKLQ